MFAKPIHAEDLRLADLAGHRRAAAQPRDRVGLSDRLDVQADHGAGGAGERPDHAEPDDRRHRPLRARHRRSTRTPSRRELRLDQHVRRAEGLLGHLLLPARRAGQRPRTERSSAGRSRLGLRPQDGDRPARRVRGPRAGPQVARRGVRRSTSTCTEKEHVPQDTTTPRCTSAAAIERPWTAGDNVNLAVGQGDLQATPLQLAVAYSALANDGTIVAPHLGQAIEDGNGVHDAGASASRAAAQDQARPARPRGRSSTACTRGHDEPERHVGRRLQGLAEGLPGLRQDRHGRARRRTPTSPGTPASSTTRRGRSSSS